MMKPLFIPLKSEYYEAFKNGTKRDELRRYGPRWNEKTCFVGRQAVLSKGYGKQNRTGGTVSKFRKMHGTEFGIDYQEDIIFCYGTIDVWIACISIDIDDGR
jgi:hypothetical protein